MRSPDEIQKCMDGDLKWLLPFFQEELENQKLDKEITLSLDDLKEAILYQSVRKLMLSSHDSVLKEIEILINQIGFHRLGDE